MTISKTYGAQGIVSLDVSISIDDERWERIVSQLKGAGVRHKFDAFKVCINQVLSQYHAHQSLKKESIPSAIKKELSALRAMLTDFDGDDLCPQDIVDRLNKGPKKSKKRNFQLRQLIRAVGGSQMTQHYRSVPMTVDDFCNVLTDVTSLVDSWGITGALPEHEKQIVIELVDECLGIHFNLHILTDKNHPTYVVALEVIRECEKTLKKKTEQRNIDHILKLHRARKELGENIFIKN